MKAAAGVGVHSIIKNKLCTNETSEIIQRLFAVEIFLILHPHGFCVVAAAVVSDHPVIAF
jgi:hypothetical protein